MAGSKRRAAEAEPSREASANLKPLKARRLQPLRPTDPVQDAFGPAATADDTSLLHDTVGAVFVDATGTVLGIEWSALGLPGSSCLRMYAT